jgi:hypothetical protein
MYMSSWGLIWPSLGEQVSPLFVLTSSPPPPPPTSEHPWRLIWLVQDNRLFSERSEMACRGYLKMQNSMTYERYDRCSTVGGKKRVKLLSHSTIQHFPCHLANMSEKRKLFRTGSRTFVRFQSECASVTLIQTLAQAVKKRFKRKKSKYSNQHCYR